MYSLPRPTITANEIYSVSFSKIRSVELRGRHELETVEIRRASKQLAEAAESGNLETLDPEDFQPVKVSVKEMVNLFERGLQAKAAPGRWFYDELVSAAPYEQCPYCGERRIESVDHYLPKKRLQRFISRSRKFGACLQRLQSLQRQLSPFTR